jgi:hypothetical protein
MDGHSNFGRAASALAEAELIADHLLVMPDGGLDDVETEGASSSRNKLGVVLKSA